MTARSMREHSVTSQSVMAGQLSSAKQFTRHIELMPRPSQLCSGLSFSLSSIAGWNGFNRD